MITLGIETSGPTASVALLRDQICLNYRQLQRAGDRPARNLVPVVQSMLSDCNLQPTDCDTLAVSIGPGSFTGLRIGTVFAKSFAYATDCPLVAVDTFLCVAQNSPQNVPRVWVIGDALRGDLYVGCYRRDEQQRWIAEQTPIIENASTWASQLRADDTVSGPGLSTIQQHVPADCQTLDPTHWYPRADRLAEIGQTLAAEGQFHDLFSLGPAYLRRSSAEDTWDARKHSNP